MKNFFKYTCLFCAWIATEQCKAQQLFPVQVNGILVPPRALNINVYSTDRSQDLTFFATLTDRDEPFLDVRLRLTIESKGKVIYRTDPNFRGPIINLRQFQTLTIRGSDLAPYLTSRALVGPNSEGMGSVELPEGFNRICLEVMGIVREVPVSNKFCVQGNFKLNPPPFLIKPSCGSHKKLPVMQNLLFNWRPMHRGSSNSPGVVEYEFRLVQLPQGTSNINDAFESSLQVYRTTTSNPTFFYGPSQPRLQAGKVYAWRVTAVPANYRTSVLFSNNGVSEVCSFSYYEEEPGGGTFPGGTGTGGTNINEKDKAPPTGCEVYRTDYGPITSASPNSIPVVEEDIIKVGYFDLEVRSAAPSGGGYSGIGIIEVPLLDCAVNVEFKNLKVNSSFRAFQVDAITAEVDPQFSKKKAQMMGGQMGSVIDDRYIKSLDKFFREGGGTDRLTSGFDPSDPVPINLPVGLDQDNKPILAIIGMEFTERNAYMTAVAWQSQTEGKYLKFGEVGIPFAPFGTKNKSELKLLEKGEGGLIEMTPSLSITFESGRIRGMAIDCNGSQKISQPAGIKVSQKILLKSGSNAPFYIDPKLSKEETMTFVGKVDDLNSFTLTGYQDIEMSAKTAHIDFSTEGVLKIESDFDDYDEIEDEEWRGLVLDDVKVALPRNYDIQGNNKEIDLLDGQIIIGPDDLAAGRASRRNRVDLDDNFLGTWPFSEDSIYADLGPEQYLNINNYGRIKTPFFVDTFDYKGVFIKNDSGAVFWKAKPQSEVLRMPMWNAQFTRDTSSNILVKKINFEDRPSEYVPKLEFSGQLLMNIRERDFMDGVKGNKGLIRKTLIETLGVDSLHFVCMNLELDNLTIDPKNPPNYIYYMDEWEQDDLNVSVGGKEFPVEVVNLIHGKKTIALPNRVCLKIGFRVETTMIEYSFWSQEVNGEYRFEGIEVYSYFFEPGSN